MRLRCLVVGLGNLRSNLQRHNLGSDVLKAYAAQRNLGVLNTKTSLKTPKGESLLFIPQTFMNVCGSSVKRIVQQTKPEHIVVIHDDLSRALGKVSPKDGGSAQGHNGVRSIINALGTEKFQRLRLGIGRPASKSDVADWVLEKWTRDEFEVVQTSTKPLAFGWLDNLLGVEHKEEA
eukprot:Clim_evm3s139 gene=Clim_evmTU3s139